jgi:hypothetical protein
MKPAGVKWLEARVATWMYVGVRSDFPSPVLSGGGLRVERPPPCLQKQHVKLLREDYNDFDFSEKFLLLFVNNRE